MNNQQRVSKMNMTMMSMCMCTMMQMFEFVRQSSDRSIS